MKNSQSFILAAALTAISGLSLAELKELEDAELEKHTGQAGITIDLEIKLNIGEIAFRDGGTFVVQGVRIGANTNLKRDSSLR